MAANVATRHAVNVHGRKDETTQEVVRLSIVCEKCEAVDHRTKACRAEGSGSSCDKLCQSLRYAAEKT
jgi:hypothetical protein